MTLWSGRFDTAPDPAIAQHFVAYFKPLLRRRLRNSGVSADIMEDIEQETYMRVLRIIKSPAAIRHPERFGAFVLAICSHVLQEFLRKPRHISLDPDHCVKHEGPNPETMAVNTETLKQLAKALANLSASDRSLVRMLLQDKSSDEACRELNVNPTAFRVRLHRARTRLHRGLHGTAGNKCQRTGTKTDGS